METYNIELVGSSEDGRIYTIPSLMPYFYIAKLPTTGIKVTEAVDEIPYPLTYRRMIYENSRIIKDGRWLFKYLRTEEI